EVCFHLVPAVPSWIAIRKNLRHLRKFFGARLCEPQRLARQNSLRVARDPPWRRTCCGSQTRAPLRLRLCRRGTGAPWISALHRGGIKAPNTKLQTPKKSQAPNPNSAPDAAALELGIWNFSGVWCLGFGVSPCRPSGFTLVILSPAAASPARRNSSIPASRPSGFSRGETGWRKGCPSRSRKRKFRRRSCAWQRWTGLPAAEKNYARNKRSCRWEYHKTADTPAGRFGFGSNRFAEFSSRASLRSEPLCPGIFPSRRRSYGTLRSSQTTPGS